MYITYFYHICPSTVLSSNSPQGITSYLPPNLMSSFCCCCCYYLPESSQYSLYVHKCGPNPWEMDNLTAPITPQKSDSLFLRNFQLPIFPCQAQSLGPLSIRVVIFAWLHLVQVLCRYYSDCMLMCAKPCHDQKSAFHSSLHQLSALTFSTTLLQCSLMEMGGGKSWEE